MATWTYPQVGPHATCESGHVAGDLEAAAEAYQAARQRVDGAKAEVAAAQAALPEARQRLATAIVARYKAGGQPGRVSEIARVTGYGREQVRRILRAAGIERPGADEE